MTNNHCIFQRGNNNNHETIACDTMQHTTSVWHAIVVGNNMHAGVQRRCRSERCSRQLRTTRYIRQPFRDENTPARPSNCAALRVLRPVGLSIDRSTCRSVQPKKHVLAQSRSLRLSRPFPDGLPAIVVDPTVSICFSCGSLRTD